ENVCHCRPSREWGTICAHSVAVGLHFLLGGKTETASTAEKISVQTKSNEPPSKTVATRRLQRSLDQASGEPAELFVIFPPNLTQALDKGKVMLCFEAKWKNGRTPLSALPLSTAFHFSEADARLLDALEMLSPGEIPAMFLLNAASLEELLPALAEHPRLSIGKSEPLRVAREPIRLQFKATLENSGEISFAMSGKNPRGKIVSSGWMFSDSIFQPLPKSAVPIFAALQSAPRCDSPKDQRLQIARHRIPQFLSQEWPALLHSCDIEADFSLEDFSFAPQAPQFILHLAGGLAQLHAQLQCAYGPRIMTPGISAPGETLWLPDPQNVTHYSTRDFVAEQTALSRILRPGFTGPDAQGRYHLAGQNQVLNFFAREFPRLQKEWQVTLEERLQHSTAKNLEWVEPQFQVTSSGVQWFDLNVSFASHGGEKFSSAEIQRLIRSGQSHTQLRNGKIAVIDTGAVEELQEVLLDAAPQQHAQVYRLDNAQAGFVEATLREQNGWKVSAPADWSQRARQQSGQAKIECPPLGDLENVLRPYQKTGVAWMKFLRENNFGGILADEMGLGKTLQALAFVKVGRASRPPEDRRDACPTLVI
ncbi:MAG: SNF2 helicase associated domain-containing protein, partial [Verrucomicrobiota bacterium]